MKKELRKPTEEEKNQFKKTDEKLDEIRKQNAEEAKRKAASNVELRKKTFMTISDVDVDDAAWLKKFCDTHVAKKQFLGIKVIRTVMQNLGPLVENVLVQINNLTKRIDDIEETMLTSQRVAKSIKEISEGKEELRIPKGQGQGSNKSKFKKEEKKVEE